MKNKVETLLQENPLLKETGLDEVLRAVPTKKHNNLSHLMLSTLS